MSRSAIAFTLDRSSVDDARLYRARAQGIAVQAPTLASPMLPTDTWQNERFVFNAPKARALDVVDVLRRDEIEHASARLKSFRGFGDDWDGEGAAAPSSPLIDVALTFLSRLQPWHPTPYATLDYDGSPVIEFRDDATSLFGSIKFVSETEVEIFSSADGGTFYEGPSEGVPVERFLSDQLQVTLN